MKILLITDEPFAAAGFLNAVEKQLAGVDAEVSSLAEFTAARPEEIDVIVLDMSPVITYDTVCQIHKDLPKAPIALWARELGVSFARTILNAGVVGLIAKTRPVDEQVRALVQVSEGKMCFEKSFLEQMLTCPRVSLTGREGQLLALITQGLRNKDIGHALGIAEGTVKVYLSRMFGKLGVTSRNELARYGLQNLGYTKKTGAADKHPIRTLCMS